MPLYCARLCISIYPCVRACPSAMMSFCVHNRQLLVHRLCIFSCIRVAEVFDSCSFLCWHPVIQLGKIQKESKTGSRPVSILWCGGRPQKGAAFLYLTPGFFSHSKIITRMWGRFLGQWNRREEKWQPSINEYRASGCAEPVRGSLWLTEKVLGKKR